jgi:hypothetical protein
MVDMTVASTRTALTPDIDLLVHDLRSLYYGAGLELMVHVGSLIVDRLYHGASRWQSPKGHVLPQADEARRASVSSVDLVTRGGDLSARAAISGDRETRARRAQLSTGSAWPGISRAGAPSGTGGRGSMADATPSRGGACAPEHEPGPDSAEKTADFSALSHAMANAGRGTCAPERSRENSSTRGQRGGRPVYRGSSALPTVRSVDATTVDASHCSRSLAASTNANACPSGTAIWCGAATLEQRARLPATLEGGRHRVRLWMPVRRFLTNR